MALIPQLRQLGSEPVNLSLIVEKSLVLDEIPMPEIPKPFK
jgi:hypothetical protein